MASPEVLALPVSCSPRQIDSFELRSAATRSWNLPELRAQLRLISLAWICGRRDLQSTKSSLACYSCSSKSLSRNIAPEPAKDDKLDRIPNVGPTGSTTNHRITVGCASDPWESLSVSSEKQQSRPLFQEPLLDVVVDWTSPPCVSHGKGKKRKSTQNNTDKSADNGGKNGKGGDGGEDNTEGGDAGGGGVNSTGGGENTGAGDGDDVGDGDTGTGKGKGENASNDNIDDLSRGDDRFSSIATGKKKNRKGQASPELDPVYDKAQAESGERGFLDIGLGNSNCVGFGVKSELGSWATTWNAEPDHAAEAVTGTDNQAAPSRLWNLTGGLCVKDEDFTVTTGKGQSTAMSKISDEVKDSLFGMTATTEKKSAWGAGASNQNVVVTTNNSTDPWGWMSSTSKKGKLGFSGPVFELEHETEPATGKKSALGADENQEAGDALDGTKKETDHIWDITTAKRGKKNKGKNPGFVPEPQRESAFAFLTEQGNSNGKAGSTWDVGTQPSKKGNKEQTDQNDDLISPPYLDLDPRPSAVKVGDEGGQKQVDDLGWTAFSTFTKDKKKGKKGALHSPKEEERRTPKAVTREHGQLAGDSWDPWGKDSKGDEAGTIQSPNGGLESAQEAKDSIWDEDWGSTSKEKGRVWNHVQENLNVSAQDNSEPPDVTGDQEFFSSWGVGKGESKQPSKNDGPGENDSKKEEADLGTETAAALQEEMELAALMEKREKRSKLSKKDEGRFRILKENAAIRAKHTDSIAKDVAEPAETETIDKENCAVIEGTEAGEKARLAAEVQAKEQAAMAAEAAAAAKDEEAEIAALTRKLKKKKQLPLMDMARLNTLKENAARRVEEQAAQLVPEDSEEFARAAETEDVKAANAAQGAAEAEEAQFQAEEQARVDAEDAALIESEEKELAVLTLKKNKRKGKLPPRDAARFDVLTGKALKRAEEQAAQADPQEASAEVTGDVKIEAAGAEAVGTLDAEENPFQAEERARLHPENAAVIQEEEKELMTLSQRKTKKKGKLTQKDLARFNLLTEKAAKRAEEQVAYANDQDTFEKVKEQPYPGIEEPIVVATEEKVRIEDLLVEDEEKASIHAAGRARTEVKLAAMIREEDELAALSQKKKKKPSKFSRKDAERLKTLIEKTAKRANEHAGVMADQEDNDTRDEVAPQGVGKQAAEDAAEQRAREAEAEATFEAAAPEAAANEAEESTFRNAEEKAAQEATEAEAAKKSSVKTGEKKKKDKKSKLLDNVQSNSIKDMTPSPEFRPEPSLNERQIEELLAPPDKTANDAFSFWGVGSSAKKGTKGLLLLKRVCKPLLTPQALASDILVAFEDVSPLAQTRGGAASEAVPRKFVNGKIADRLKNFEPPNGEPVSAPITGPAPSPSVAPVRKDERQARERNAKSNHEAMAEQLDPVKKIRRASELPGSFPATDEEEEIVEPTSKEPAKKIKKNRKLASTAGKETPSPPPAPPPPAVPDPPLSVFPQEPRALKRERTKVKEDSDSWAHWNTAPAKEKKKPSSSMPKPDKTLSGLVDNTLSKDSGSDKTERFEKNNKTQSRMPKASATPTRTPPLSRTTSHRERVSVLGKMSRRHSTDAHILMSSGPNDTPEMTAKAAKVLGLNKSSRKTDSIKMPSPDDEDIVMVGATETDMDTAARKGETWRSKGSQEDDIVMVDAGGPSETHAKRMVSTTRKSGFAGLFSGLMTPRPGKADLRHENDAGAQTDREGRASGRKSRRVEHGAAEKVSENSRRSKEGARRQARRKREEEDEARRAEAKEARRAGRRAARQREEEERRALEEREERRAERRRLRKAQEAAILATQREEQARAAARRQRRRSQALDPTEESKERRERREARHARRAGELLGDADVRQQRRGCRRLAEQSGEEHGHFAPKRKEPTAWPHSGTSSWVKNHSDVPPPPPPPDDVEQVRRETRRSRRRTKHGDISADETENRQRHRRRREERRAGGSEGSHERQHSRRHSTMMDMGGRPNWWKKLTG